MAAAPTRRWRGGQAPTIDWSVRGLDEAARAVFSALGAFNGGASLDAGEVTDKGTINQKAVLKARAVLVEELYKK